MVKALFDTNILIDYLNAVPQARAELARYRDKAISVMTWMEAMVGTSAATEALTRDFLNEFLIVQLDERIAEQAVALRKAYRIKLPDAIVWASAQVHAMLLVTRNVKDFPAGEPGIRMPYKI